MNGSGHQALETSDCDIPSSELLRQLAEARETLRRAQARIHHKLGAQIRQIERRWARYAMVLANLPDMIVIFGPKLDILDVIGNSIGLVGYTPRELARSHTLDGLTDLLIESDATALINTAKSLLSASGSRSIQVQIRDRAGELRWMRITMTWLAEPEGDFSGLVSIWQDITDRVQSRVLFSKLEAAARAMHYCPRTPDQVLQEALETLQRLGYDGVVAELLPNRELRIRSITSANQLLAELCEAFGIDSAPEFPLDKIPECARALRELLPTRMNLTKPLLSKLVPDESLAQGLASILSPLHILALPLVVEGESLGLLIVAASSISEGIIPALSAFARQTAVAWHNARLVHELAQRETDYRQIFDSTSDALLVLDELGNIVRANASAARLFGLDASALEGKASVSLFRVAPQQWSVWVRQAENNPPLSLTALRQDGSTVPVSLQVLPLVRNSETKQHRLAIVTDQSMKAKVQETLAEADRLKVLGEMIGGIAHDFNNILVSIRGYADMALADLGDRNHLAEDLGQIVAGAREAAEAVRRLQMLYRPTPTETEPVPLQMDDLIRDALLLTRPYWRDQAQRRGIPIRVITRLGAPPPIRGVASELKRVLVNLIVNAVDAMPKGGVLTLTSRQDKNSAVICVSDTGVGIPRENLSRVFEPFFSTKNSSGLGLSVCQRIVSAHHGTIEVDSTLGAGTTFIIQLPIIKEATVPPTQNGLKPKRISPSIKRRGRVLVVDDEPAVSALLRRFLEREGIRVRTCTNGQEALVYLDREPFDLVITDIGLPGIPGNELAHRIHNRFPSLPIVLTTGWTDTLIDENLDQLGVVSILTKPFTRGTIEEVVQRFLGNQDRQETDNL